MKKTGPSITYIVSQVQKSLAFEWIAEGLKENGKDISFILLNPGDSELEKFLHKINVPTVRLRYRSKRDAPFVFIKLFLILLRSRPHVVHTHLWDAQLIGLISSWLVGIRSRIYTRHTSTYHHDYHPSSVWLDKLCNRLATRVISISQATDFVLLTLEKARAKKVIRIPHGIKTYYFTDVPSDRIDHLRDKWNIPKSSPVVGVIARHIEWKGVQFIVPAFKKFIAEFPTAILVLANAAGPYHKNILEHLKSVDSRRVVLIPFEEDIAALYHIFDLYVHVPVDLYCEAFGQTYVEALAAGVPSIVTRSGVGAEFLKHGENAWIVDYRNSDQISAGLKEVWQNKGLGEKLSRNGMNSVSPYSFEAMLHSLIALYNE